MLIELREQPFKPYQELARIEESLAAGAAGACASFVGTMRDSNEGAQVTGMLLEHYPEMTEKQLQRIVADAHEKWPLIHSVILHRIGTIEPGEPIVLTACWSKHRAAAFEACRFLMETLKKDATFWKKETLADESQRWVKRNTPGYTSADVNTQPDE